ncbi:hypothetical protein M2336_001703 [Sphingobium sp. B1D7B]|uniref:hypothetical protein n=1 Tax=Sphingobium sp. B1D7B TaxID=2940578 RepID=UPI0022242B8F|nr:hypothetical protein [Sphingobium sp. B1D7B]MCW2405074.1 hypothetical protein [Sphingobium sp. B1D7B]
MNISNFPAFPCEAQGDRSVPQEHDYVQTGIHTGKFPGLTIRDWLAGQALIGLLSNSVHDHSPLFGEGEPFARDAYIIADAMLAARKQEPQP